MRPADGKRDRDRSAVESDDAVWDRGRFSIDAIVPRRLNPPDDRDDLENHSKDDLYQTAKRLKIEGRSRMTREQLIAAIRAAEDPRRTGVAPRPSV